MNLGDVLQGHATVWLVRKIEPGTKTAFLEAQNGELRVLGFEELETSGFTRVGNAVQDWPSVALPQRAAKVVRVELASIRRPQELRRFHDWVKFDEYQIGGALYLNPQLRLVFRDRLILTHDDGQRWPLEIPRDFKPYPARAAAQRARQLVGKQGDPTVFDHLLKDDE